MVAFAVLAVTGCSSHKNEEPPAAQAPEPQPYTSTGAEAERAQEPTQPAIQEPVQPGSEQPNERQTPTALPEDQNAAPIADEQTVRILTAVNGGEVDQAKMAQQKAKDPRVKKFAQMMVTQHSKAKDKVIQLSKKEQIMPAGSSVSDELQEKGSQTLASLGQAQAGEDFDKIYMDAQVQQHQEVLDMLNSRLIPSANNAQLKTELEGAKKMVEQHLAKAREIHRVLRASRDALPAGLTRRHVRRVRALPAVRAAF
jgi:putative membrane protein